MEEQEQCNQLESLNDSILVLLLLIAGVLLSFSATVDQRNTLAQTLCGEYANTTDPLPKRRFASILIAGTTGFFAWLAAHGMTSAQHGTCSDRRSAQANLIAAVLVFVAALIRLNDLNLIACDRLSQTSDRLVAPQNSAATGW